ncbi:prolyl oligopeptidase family serine peptidase [Streptomyces sp. NPDC004111]|uniref:prolyl oligopeptidase family serine peptidase n=1 Tax=Streptomyces sp. NPDC004111 TaxID=3364690 RepID=UPI00368D1F15
MQLRVAPALLPTIAELAPDRGCFAGEADDRCEVFAWDLARGTVRQVTDRPGLGTDTADVDPCGRTVWWFEDGPTGSGRWLRQPWEGGADTPALPGAAPGAHGGLAMAADGTAAVGLLGPDGLSLHVRSPEGDVRTLLTGAGHGELVDLSADGTLLAVCGEPTDPAAVRVLDRSGRTVATLPGTRHPLWAMGFGPDPGPPRLLLVVEREGCYRLGTWSVVGGRHLVEWCRFDTEISASWCPDGRVLVRQDRHGRSTLSVVDLLRRTRTPLETPPGTLLDARMQPVAAGAAELTGAGGDLHYLWTDTATPPVLRTASGRRPPGEQAVAAGPAVRVRDRWTPGPGGPLHTLFSAPAHRPRPWPTVLLVHGGPFEQDRDAYDPTVTLLTAAGFAVARVNYRGSTGYGPAWRNAFDDGVGLTQVADLAAVRANLVRAGLADPERVALAGWSWGGYLTLLALGSEPGLWRAGAAVHPVADSVAAFRTGTSALRSLDTRLFGGTPDEVPHRYAESSPMTYVSRVRAPVLLVAGGNDVKCPPEQIVAYADALRAHGAEPELLELDTGHESRAVQCQATALIRVVTFLGAALGGRVAAEAL